MKQVVIENPILNSPFEMPRRHFKFDEFGITDEIEESRRLSSYFIPIASPRKATKQATFETQWLADRNKICDEINEIRSRVNLWRDQGFPGITPATRQLLDYWTRPGRERRLFFCQIEAVETIIYLTECAEKANDAFLVNRLKQHNQDAGTPLFRIACKMATGSGKTVVMAMLITWHVLNRRASTNSGRYSDSFLLVAPGITIRDRLRVLLPSDPANYYAGLDLVPPEHRDDLGAAKIVVSNFHGFQCKETLDAAKLTKAVLTRSADGVFTETPAQMVRRVCREFGNKRNIIAINDEAHHCYRSKPVETDEKLIGDDRKEAEEREEAVPIYIQEKIHPQALIDDLRARAQAGKPQELNLFADFNGLDDDFSKKVDFYKHDQHWTNRLILGDSLLVMTSLAEKERLKDRVQMIYLDPPYGIKFGSNWQVSTRKRDVKDGKAEDLVRQPEQIKAFRDTWEHGIHSYLTALRDRLSVARELLTDSGSIFVQIGDENVHVVRNLMDEVLGSDNFVTQIVYTKTTGATVVMLPGTIDYVIWYAKDIKHTKYRRLFTNKVAGGEGAAKYDQVELVSGERRPQTAEEKSDPTLLPSQSRPYRFDNLMSQSMGREKGEGAACWFPVKIGAQEFRPNIQSRWKTNEEGMKRLRAANRIQVTRNTLAYVRFLDDFPAYPITNAWTDIGGIQSRADPKIYVVQTATTAVERGMMMTTDPGDLVLDPTCGSGTTAYVAEQWGRRWIAIDTSRVALALARTRLMAAKFPYFLLIDSPEGRKKEMDVTGAASPVDASPCTNDVQRGFVCRRIRHVTLKSIATNPEIKEGMARIEVDAAIDKRADTETLVDQPYEDKGIIRVCGPFTVESLSPHRMLPRADGTLAPKAEQFSASATDFTTTILDNLRKAGVQNTVKSERLNFDRLDTFPGVQIHAEGEYTEKGKSKRVKVCIGPEFGTVDPVLVREAAKEAMQGVGCDLLLVCGFAFDPHVSEEAKKFGKLTVLCPRMNPDLAMGDELLKKTGASNLFTVFGEPDLKLERAADGKLSVEILGVDVYDPTTGAIRSHSTDDIACWFIDTDYNEESFFVRHAYFCGGDDPYDKLKRALRAEIDEAEWSKLYETRSVPFETPSKDKIAVKVINHYGDEVLKVYPVAKVTPPGTKKK